MHALIKRLDMTARRFRTALGRAMRGKSASRTGRVIALLTGPVLLVSIMLLPLDMTREQQNLLALIAMTVLYWITQALPIPITSILALGLAVVFNVASANEVFSAFSSPTLFLLIGGFIMTRAMIKYGLGHRIAMAVLSFPGIAGSTYRIIIVFGALAALLSSVVDNGAVAAMLLPIAVGLIRALDDDVRNAAGMKHDGSRLRFATALMLMTAYGATVGALLTPFGDGSNLVGWYFVQDHFDITIRTADWMLIATPVVIALFIALSGIILFFNRPETHHLPHAGRDIRRQRRELGAMSSGEINTSIAFSTAILLWLMPPVIGVFTGYSSSAYEFVATRLNPAAVAVLAAVMLFVLPRRNHDGFTLRWKDTTDMDWGPVLLMGSGLALASLMGVTGLAEVIGNKVAAAVQGIGAIGVYFFAGTMAMLFSELTSNLVSISILVPIIPSMSVAGGGDPVIATLVATFAAIYGFMLPISTSANVIVYGSGQIPFLKMLKTGFFVDITGIIIVVTGVLTMLKLVGLGA